MHSQHARIGSGSSARSEPSISFEYRRPPWLAQLGWGMGVLALGAFLAAGLPFPLKLGGVAGGLLGAGLRQRRCRPQPLRQFIWHADGHWTVQSETQRAQPLQLLRQRHWGGVWVLEFAPEQGRRFGVWLAPGQLAGPRLRQLQLRLRRGCGLSPIATSGG